MKITIELTFPEGIEETERIAEIQEQFAQAIEAEGVEVIFLDEELAVLPRPRRPK